MRELVELMNEVPAADGVAIWSGDHRVRLKWHRLKRHRDDVPFTPTVLAEALALGASSEIDLRLHAEDGFVVLHDETLDRETTGSGPVASATIATLRGLSMRHPDGTPSEEAVLLLDDLVLLAKNSATPDALVQLDLKETAAVLTPAVVARFAAIVAPVADRCILSCADIEAVRILAGAVPGLAAGYDPSEPKVVAGLATADEYAGFVAAAIDTAGAASTIYLDYPIVLKAAALGYDVVGAFHAADKLVDAWTLNTDHPDAATSLRHLVALEVDQITTDEPIALQALFESSDNSQG
ncbi:Glycerophosphoryl diester phosphodiesterase [Kaistia soli DSM 19436]|uniref:Glycerophosphoryl diester phosphodiesterase n=1 Tax=Kaistia soli DSM 19436 TaxID=1122133 RepID=A0A1M4ZNU7_9HYPH|nr:glycerophosphodiester phosphodiesterase family protein [Kaistia soli]SHF19674.1 Glycerophosphoryl diester phosphodiesterase [Kaistia soli DSM 19436]